MRDKLLRYGYKWLGMEEIPYELALKLVNEIEVYLLYEDDTESLAENTDDIKRHFENGGEFGIELNEFDNYVVFVLGRDLLKNIVPYDENDLAYDFCVNVAKDFQVSEYNVSSKGLYECLEEYVSNNFYKNDDNEMTFKGYDLEETCLGMRV